MATHAGPGTGPPALVSASNTTGQAGSTKTCGNQSRRHFRRWPEQSTRPFTETATGRSRHQEAFLMFGSKIALGSLVLGTALAALTATAPAQAATQGPGQARAATAVVSTASVPAPDFTCQDFNHGDLCVWFLRDFQGSKVGFGINLDYVNHLFVKAGSGAGAGQQVANNSESFFNYSHTHTARLWTGPDFTGTSLDVRPQTGGNFGSAFMDNVESLQWIS